MKERLFFFGCLLALVGCQSISGPPRVDTALTGLSSFVFRGAVQRGDPVLQPDINVSLATTTLESIDFGVWGNLDVTHGSEGDAYPESRAGSFSRIDWTLSGSTKFDGITFTGGAKNYSFPSSATGSTTELFFTGAWDAFGLSPELSVYIDVDAVKGYYANLGVSGAREMNEKWRAEWGLDVGATDRDHALGYYASRTGGLADLNLTGAMVYAYSMRTTVRLTAALSTLMTTAHRDALNAAGIDETNIVIGFVLGWGI